MRLAPAFALRHGINPYPLLDGGPISTWIYGPVGILVDLPATFATSPAGALHLASLIAALTILFPLAVIFFGSLELRTRGAGTPWLALALGVLLLPPATLLFQVPDQSAIALGLLSGWCLARQPRPPAPWLAAAAALCVLAILAKQLEVVLLPVHLAFLLGSRNRTAAIRYTGWFVVFGLAAAAICLPVFGFDNLWLNLVAVPGQRPWANFSTSLATRPWPLIAQVLLPSAGLVALWRMGQWPDRTRESGRFFHFAALAYGVMLPLGLAAFFKFGGDTNTIHSWAYLFPAGLLVWLATDRTTAAAFARLMVVTVSALALHAKEFVTLPTHPITRHLEIAAQLTSAFPHAIWFPQNPIITFYADGRLWHSEDGIRTRNHAGYPPRQADFRRYLPPNLQAVAYPESEDLAMSVTLALLPEFSRRTNLLYWTLLTRPPAPPVPP